MSGRRLVIAALAGLVLAGPTAAHADPPLTVTAAQQRAALACDPQVRDARGTPVLLVTGTGGDPGTTWPLHQAALAARGHPTCTVALPEHGTGDMQVATELVVAAIRALHRRAGRPIAVFGMSQGAVLPRMALTWWPSLRPLVSDVVAAAGTQHGTTAGVTVAPDGLPPAAWQQRAGSRLLTALNAHDETPGPTAWTTVRSDGDRSVTPTSRPSPTSALRGAANVRIQAVCPGRVDDHVGVLFDSVTFALLLDALGHRGPADPARLPSDVCAHLALPGMSDEQKAAAVAAAYPMLLGRILSAPRVAAEPALRPPFAEG